MQGPPTPTEDDEASIPTEHLQASIPAEHLLTVPHLGAGSRKAAMRTFPWKLTTEELQLELPRPQDEDEETRETKRPRLEEPLRTSIYAGTTENTSHATTAALSPPDAAADTADSVPVMNIRPNAGTTRDTRCWTLDEDAQLTSAFTKTREKKWGKKFKIDWVAVAMLVPGRTQRQCRDRWHNTLVSSTEATTARAGHWTPDEDKTLKDAVPTHGDKNWEKIAALIPGRTQKQCRNTWHNRLVSNIDPTTALAGKWTADEDKKLKDSVREHDGKNWEKVAASVIGRTKAQCHSRWFDTLVSKIDPTMALVGKWTADEDKTLKDGVRAHGGKNWKAITALVPGRTQKQCRSRWHHNLVSNIDPTTTRVGKWTADEDKNLKDAVRAHGGKNWKGIAALVPGRTKAQCRTRWTNISRGTALCVNLES
jgi:hypothetical protein